MPGRDPGEAWKGANQAWSAIGTMLAGIVVWGGVGWLLDRWLGFDGLFLPIGMLLGMQKKLAALKNSRLILCGVGPRLLELLKITRLDRMLTVKPSQAEAVRSSEGK